MYFEQAKMADEKDAKKDSKSCLTCAYGGRPSYKSPCSECANMSKYEKEVR